MVGWKIGSEVVYLAEGNAADTGTAIKWAQELGEELTLPSFLFSSHTCNEMCSNRDRLSVCPPSAVMAELFANVQDTSAMAYSVSDSGGVCFVPSFSGLQVPCVSVCVVKLFDFCLFYHNYATVPTPISTGDNYITRTGMIIHS